MKTCFCIIVVGLGVFWSPGLWTQESEQQSDNKEVSDVIRATRFELVDNKGRVRIEMNMDEGNPVFKLKDETGKDRVVIFHQADATGVYVKDAAEDTRVGLAQFSHGGGLAMHGEKGKGSAVYVLMNNKARLDIYDPAGKLINRWPEKNEK